MASTPEIGAVAPDFTLPGTKPGVPDSDYTLSAERGHPVVLAFYPGDETPVCTRQLCSYQHDLDILRDLDVTLWGISSQGIESHKRFQEHRGLSFPLLADVDSNVFKAYGLGSVLNRRAVFVIDGDGKIAWRHVSTTGVTYQKLDRIAEVVRNLTTATYPAEVPSQSPAAPEAKSKAQTKATKPTA